MMVSEEVAKNLADPELAGFLESQNRAFLLGSLAPDFPYYEILTGYRGLSLGGVGSAVSHGLEGMVMKWFGRPPADAPAEIWPFWSRRFHGPRASLWVLDWLGHAMPADTPSLSGGAIAAFMLGMLSHITTDEVMHPRVEKDSGDQASYQGQQLHRQLEMRLDFRLLKECGLRSEGFVPSQLLQRWIFPGPGSQGGLFPMGLAREWARVAALSGGQLEISRIERWFEGFTQAAALMGHTLSPLRQAQKFLRNQDKKLDNLLAQGAYLEVLFPRAVSESAAVVDQAWKNLMRTEANYARA
jgi:hypothetical protein